MTECVEHMIVEAPYGCSRCGAAGRLLHGATARGDGRLHTWASFHCHACGTRFEFDDDQIPTEVRPLFYEK